MGGCEKGKKGSGKEKLRGKKRKGGRGRRRNGEVGLGEEGGRRSSPSHLHCFSLGDYCCSPGPYSSPSSG